MKIRQVMAFAAVIGVLSVCLQTTPAFAQDSDYVRMNRTIELLESGQAALGVLSADYSLGNAQTLASSNLDFIIIDMEHYPFDVERLRLFLLGMTDKRQIQQKGNLQMNVTPFVRVPAAEGVPCAITTGAGTVEQRLNEGFRFVTVGFDGGISAGVTTALERGRAAAGR